jgi:hypothetical protein
MWDADSRMFTEGFIRSGACYAGFCDAVMSFVMFCGCAEFSVWVLV